MIGVIGENRWFVSGYAVGVSLSSWILQANSVGFFFPAVDSQRNVTSAKGFSCSA